MGTDLARVALIQAAGPQAQSFGSGYAIGGRVVLTAAHVVSQSAAGAAARALADVKVRFQADRGPAAGRWWTCEVTWLQYGDLADAALLTIVDAGWPAASDFEPVRWGRLTGSSGGIGCEVVSYPRSQRDPDASRDTEHLLGHINPGTSVARRRYEIHVEDSVPRTMQDGRTPWAGASGAAVTCDNLLVGVVRADRPDYLHARLTATPASELAGDESFRVAVRAGTGRSLLLESAELAWLFATPYPQAEPESPSFLLRPDVEAVAFSGREDALAQLGDWCRGADSSPVLLTGPAGQGKTRLARRLMSERYCAGWVCGELLAGDTVPADAAARLADTTIPLLVVVDHAETRPDQVQAIAEALRARQHESPVRLLLVAREGGDWWRQLIGSSRAFADADELALGPLYGDDAARLTGFGGAVHDLAAPLSRMLGYRDNDWAAIAAAIAAPDGLDQESYGSALTVQMAALTALLEHARPHDSAGGNAATPADSLLAYERDYWHQSASTFGLAVGAPTLARAAASAALYGAATKEDAVAILSHVDGLADLSYDQRESAALWIRQLYPPAPGAYWGYLQPDRIAERLVAVTTSDSPGLLEQVVLVVTPAQQVRALTVFGRCGAPYKARWFALARILRRDPATMAGPVIYAAVAAEDPAPFQAALAELVQRPDLTYDDCVLLYNGIRQSSSLAVVSLLLAERLAERMRTEARKDARYLPELARVLSNLSSHRAALGHANAIKAAGEAINICNRLLRPRGRIRKRPPEPEFLALYQQVLTVFADRIAMLSPRLAVGTLEESVRICRGLPPEGAGVLQNLATSLNHLARYLAQCGDSEQGLKAATEALDVCARLATQHQAPSPAAQADALLNSATCLAQLGRHEEAAGRAEQAAAIFRSLAESEPVTYRLKQAIAMRTLSGAYSTLGRFAEGRAAADEAVRCCRRLTRNGVAGYAAELADSLGWLALSLRGAGQPEAATGAMTEAVSIYQNLADPLTGSDRYLPKLAQSTVDLGIMLMADGGPAEAAETLLRGWQLTTKAGSKDIADDAAALLRHAHDTDPAAVAAAWQHVSGQEPLPEWLAGGAPTSA